jgi:hypothetical protein
MSSAAYEHASLKMRVLGLSLRATPTAAAFAIVGCVLTLICVPAFEGATLDSGWGAVPAASAFLGLVYGYIVEYLKITDQSLQGVSAETLGVLTL